MNNENSLIVQHLILPSSNQAINDPRIHKIPQIGTLIPPHHIVIDINLTQTPNPPVLLFSTLRLEIGAGREIVLGRGKGI